MFNELILGVVTPFSGSTTPDRNGLSSVMIQCIAGKMPNRNVLSGTVAQRSGFEVGKTYLIDVREQGRDMVYGLDFNFILVKEMTSGTDIIDATVRLGKPEIFVVDKPEGAALYDRKGNAIESERTRRIKEGSYEPAFTTTAIDHKTSKEVVPGSTQEGWGAQQTDTILKRLTKDEGIGILPDNSQS